MYINLKKEVRLMRGGKEGMRERGVGGERASDDHNRDNQVDELAS